jgi:hypothetical protein
MSFGLDWSVDLSSPFPSTAPVAVDASPVAAAQAAGRDAGPVAVAPLPSVLPSAADESHAIVDDLLSAGMLLLCLFRNGLGRSLGVTCMSASLSCAH